MGWKENTQDRSSRVSDSTEQICAVPSWQHPRREEQSNGFPLSKEQHVYSRSTVLHGPIWEFVSEQNYLPHDKNLCLRNYFGKRPSAGGGVGGGEMNDSGNKALITALLRGWMRKQGSKELFLEHVLEQAVGIDCNVMQRLVAWDTPVSWLPVNEAGLLHQPWFWVVPEQCTSSEEGDFFLLQASSALDGI